MTKERIDRINELARKAKTPAGLTPEEQAEQAALRREYVEAVKASLRSHLDNTVVLYPDGSSRRLEPKKK